MIAIPAGIHTDMVAQYVTEQTGAQFTPGTFAAMMVVDDKRDFVAGIVFSNHRGTDVEVSCAGETPMAWRPWVCKAVFQYVFDQLGCVRCTSITVKGNTRARDFLTGLGFELEGKLRLGYDGTRDALIYGLLRSDCRFLADDSEMVDGEEKQPSGTGSAGPGSDGASPSGG